MRPALTWLGLGLALGRGVGVGVRVGVGVVVAVAVGLVLGSGAMWPALTLKSGGSSSPACSAVCSAAPRDHGLMKRGAQLGSPPAEREM